MIVFKINLMCNKDKIARMRDPSIVVDSLGNVHIVHKVCVEGNPLDYNPDCPSD